MLRTFAVPSNEEDYLKGIIRNSRVKVKATRSYYDYPKDETALIGDNHFYYWHSEYDESFSLMMLLPL